MKKYLGLLACIVALVLILSGCESSSGSFVKGKPTQYETLNNLDGVTMSVKEGTLSFSGLTVNFANTSNKQCIYGDYFLLERKINAKWYQVPPIIDNYGFHSIGYDLAPGRNGEWEVDWSWLYGKLDPGEYRIVKDVLNFRGAGDYDKYYLAAEFVIGEQMELADLAPMVRIKGKLYQDTGRESDIQARCGVMDGEITSSVKPNIKPTRDDQSNFGSGYGYQFVDERSVDIFMNEKWIRFELSK